MSTSADPPYDQVAVLQHISMVHTGVYIHSGRDFDVGYNGLGWIVRIRLDTSSLAQRLL